MIPASQRMILESKQREIICLGSALNISQNRSPARLIGGGCGRLIFVVYPGGSQTPTSGHFFGEETMPPDLGSVANAAQRHQQSGITTWTNKIP
mmetsp:Transcript_30059/g.69346  ORF Transcript_30059/g.69346 Transcript_30059/m.69346 type:complete len:94 (-) Transcript_30059:116-397(-)